MNSYANSLGFEAFLLYFVPGAIVVLAVLIALFDQDVCQLFLSTKGCLGATAALHGNHLKDAEATYFGVVLILSGAFGCVIAVMSNWIEKYCLDRHAAEKVWEDWNEEDALTVLEWGKLSTQERRDQFDNIWYWYVVNLPSLKNAYITHLVFRLHFTTRISVACGFAFLAFLFSKAWVFAIVTFLSGLLLRYGAGVTSYALGVFRLLLYLRFNEYQIYAKLLNEKAPLCNNLLRRSLGGSE